MEDECELEETLQRQRIGAAVLAPFAVERLSGADQPNQIVLSVSVRNIGILGDVQRNLLNLIESAVREDDWPQAP